MRRALVGVAVAMAAFLMATGTSGAITHGEPDGNRHPNVAMISFYQPDGRFRCSATLVSPTVLVTAAHCTVGTIGKTIVTFAPEAPVRPRAIDDTGDGMSSIGFGSDVPGWLTGTAFAHPLWDDELQLNDLHDVGVVVLDEPYLGATPAALPPRHYLDTLTGKGVLQKTLFTAVGYGVFFVHPESGPQKPVVVSDQIRRLAESPGQNLTSQVLKVQENGNDSRGTGGTCFGDSGGALFQGGYLVADTSFGASQFCNGMGGFYRLDTDDARSFLDDFVAVP